MRQNTQARLAHPRLRLIALIVSLLSLLSLVVQAPQALRAAAWEQIITPRNYTFTWGSSGANIASQNTVSCSSNTDFTRVVYWRTNDSTANAGVNDWNPTIPVAGTYDIYAYIPSYNSITNITTQAKYYFNGALLATIDQNQAKCQWVYLGRRAMSAGNGDTISMPAQTTDSPSRLIAADGMKFVEVPAPTYTISGKITDASGNPFANLSVSLNTGQTALTDSSGNYSFTGLAAATYTITPPSDRNYLFSPPARTINVSANTPNQDFAITNRYAISGVIANSAGVSLPNITVLLQGLTTSATTTTNSSGRYTFYNLAAGFYQVRPTSSAYQFSPAVRGWMNVPPNRSDQNFSTAPVYGSISGKIAQEGTNQALANATVNIAGRTTTTDANGNYTLASLLPGTHTLQVSANSYQSYKSSLTIQVNVNTVANILLKPIVAEGYRIPFPGGTTYQLTRTKHRTGYAQDWARVGMNGDYIVASRAGKVIGVKSNSNSSACLEAYAKRANYVYLLHADGTQTWYLHLKQGSVTVKRNDYVRSGQIIGRSGNTGYSCGEHLHFAWMVKGKRAIPTFLDVPGGRPQAGKWYTSGNYLSAVLSEAETPLLAQDTVAPEGALRFRLTGAITHEVQIETFDFDSDTLQMRLASSEEALSSADWITATSNISWSDPIIWGQFKDQTGNISTVYSDTLEPIVYEPLQADFQVEPTVCVGTEPVIQNLSFPLSDQLGWQWDYGDGNSTQDMYGALPDSYLTGVYTETGSYTMTLTVTNSTGVGSVTRPITVIDAPSPEFAIVRQGTTITVTALEQTATSFLWDFGDGSTATGQVASHTYADMDSMSLSLVSLDITGSGGCSSDSFQSASFAYHVYLPATIR